MEDLELIYSYTRAQALEDGLLIDISYHAQEAGFKWPVAVTHNLFGSVLNPSLELMKEGQSLSGRIWDLLQILRFTIPLAPDASRLSFSVFFIMAPASQAVPVKVISTVGPGEHGEPVITIMLPGDD